MIKSTFKSTVSMTPVITTKYKKVSAKEPLWIIVDAGNSDVKAMIHGNFGEEIVFPHSVRMPTPAQYDKIKQSYSNRSSDFRGTAFFEKTITIGKETYSQGFIVGKHAYDSGSGNTITGPEKYTPYHIGALTDAALLQLYPEGHSNVHLVVLHPAKTSRSNIEALVAATGGKRELTLTDGRVVTFKVKEVVVNEESVVAFQSWLLNIEGKPYKDRPVNLLPGTRILMVDVGGWISYMGYATVNDKGGVEPITQDGAVIQAGIQDVSETFEAELKQNYPSLSATFKLPDFMIYNALMTEKIIIDDVEHDCSEEVRLALGELRQKLAVPYGQKFSHGNGVGAIVISGGGGGMSFDHLQDYLFVNKRNVYPAEKEINRMRFSAIRGTSKGLYAFLKVNAAVAMEQ